MPSSGAVTVAGRVLEVSGQGEELLFMLFPHLRGLRVGQVEDTGDTVVIRASCRAAQARCPLCGAVSSRVHGGYARVVADGAAGGRPVLIALSVRRFRCPESSCPRATFAEQAGGVSQRYRRRSVPLLGMLAGFGLELAGRAAARLAGTMGMPVHSSTVLRLVMALPDPPVTAAPAVTGVDDFALRKGHVYGTVVADAESGEVIDLLPDREAATLREWLKAHPGAEVVCRDGSGAYGEAVRQALPDAVQVSDRWHLWHGLGEAVRKDVAAHCACWAGGMPLAEGKRAATTAGRWQQVRELRARNVGLLECARRLNLSLNTVKRYDRASEPERLQRVPKYRPTLVGPHRDYLRKRRAEEPAVPVRQLLREIRERGYQGSSNLLVRYLNQGRLDSDRPHLSPRRAARILLTRPDRLTAGQHERLAGLTAACPEMTALTSLITSFAALLAPDPGNDARLRQWITDARAADLPHVHSFTRGLDLDIQAATAALTMPHHNGRTEGVNTKTKMIKRQMYGRAGFTLLRHRILLE